MPITIAEPVLKEAASSNFLGAGNPDGFYRVFTALPYGCHTSGLNFRSVKKPHTFFRADPCGEGPEALEVEFVDGSEDLDEALASVGLDPNFFYSVDTRYIEIDRLLALQVIEGEISGTDAENIFLHTEPGTWYEIDFCPGRVDHSGIRASRKNITVGFLNNLWESAERFYLCLDSHSGLAEVIITSASQSIRLSLEDFVEIIHFFHDDEGTYRLFIPELRVGVQSDVVALGEIISSLTLDGKLIGGQTRPKFSISGVSIPS